MLQSLTMAGKYRLTTLGCKVNQYESEQVRELLEACGLRPAKPDEIADLAIVNTCAVTCSATAKSRQALRKQAQKRAKHTIAIGCYASADPDAIRKIPGMGEALGHDSDVLTKLRELIAKPNANELPPAHASAPHPETPRPGDHSQVQKGLPMPLVQMGLRLERPAQVAPPEAVLKPSPHPTMTTPTDTTEHSMSSSLPIVNQKAGFSGTIRDFAHHTRAFLKVQDGCDAHCTYCIIPKLRTHMGYKPVEQAVAEARQLVAAGHREIVLTGIFLGAFGRETALRKRFAPGPSPLATLVDSLANIEGLRRLRLSSLEPGDVDDALLDVLSRRDNCVPHLHLPLQAGNGEILRRMNRQYTIDDFHRMIERVNAALDRPAISTDIIVGFPGETDALFEETLAVARTTRFCKIHAFPFSPRPGTAAAKWKSQFVHPQTVKDRMAALSQLSHELASQYETQFIGETHRVLVEGVAAKPAPHQPLVHGRTDRYFEIYFNAPNLHPGDFVKVRIDRTTPKQAQGTFISRES